MRSRAERFRNVAGCFAVKRWAIERLAGKTVCIVDNLLATGATVHEVSKVLREGGAKRIYVAVIARTVMDDLLGVAEESASAAGGAVD